MKQSNSSQTSKENNLNKYFDELKKESYDDTFSATEGWLHKITNLSTKKSERKFSIMKNYFSANKFKLAYTFLILAFIVGACNYPVTQEESVGDVLTWTVAKENTDAISQIENMDWFKKGECNFNEENGIVSYSIVIPKESHANTPDYERQLNAIPGILEINLHPLSETIQRPVYSALLNDLFKIDINATNMSNDELSKEIDTQLKNAGIENATVNFEKGSDNRRMVKIQIPEGKLIMDGGFDMTIKDGGNTTRLKEVRKTGSGDPDRFKGKTDVEIRNMIRQDLGNPNIKDDEIEIIREGEKVKVKVKVSKTVDGKQGQIETEDEIK